MHRLRRCWCCGASIYESMGSVMAYDLLRYWAGEIEATEVRETCGHCVMRYCVCLEHGWPLPFQWPADQDANLSRLLKES